MGSARAGLDPAHRAPAVIAAAQRAWTAWRAHVERPIDSRPLRLVRALLAVCLAGDLFAMVWRGALQAVLYPASHGGLAGDPAPWYLLEGWWWGGPLLFFVLAIALPPLAAGVWTRPAIVAVVLASSQLGHFYIPGDRAIDRLVRTVLLILLFSAASRRAPPARIPAWPVDLIRWILTLMYLQAGIAKLDAKPGFLDTTRPELYEITAAPLVGRLDPVFWADYPLLFAAGGLFTLALELSAPLLLTRWARYWAVFGAAMHVGIALTMELGMFSFAMLALYPVLLSPWTERALDAIDRARTARADRP